MPRYFRAARIFASLLVAGSAGRAVAQQSMSVVDYVRLFEPAGVQDGITVARVNPAALDRINLATGAVQVAAVPIAPGRTLDLRLERLVVTRPSTRFVVGASQTPLDIHVDGITLLRGDVPALPGSHAYIALADSVSNGYIQLSDGSKFGLSSRGRDGRPLHAGHVALFEVRPAGESMPPGIAMCGLDTSGWTPPPPDGFGPRGAAPIHRLRQIQMAIETDYEFFSLFNDLTAAGTYVVQLYGAISDIYIRDVNAEVMLSFVRLWDTPADLFNDP